MLLALALAAAMPATDARLADAEARLAMLDRHQSAQRARIAAAQAPLARALAASERLALRPPLLALAQPGSADDMIHTQALLRALRPAIAQRTAALRRDMAGTRAESIEAARTLALIGTERSAYERAMAARLMRLPVPPDAPAGRAMAVYRLPATGRVLTGTGERAEPGWRQRGLTLLTAPDAPVVSPGPGRVAYAGAFGGYGTIVIVDHGHGWTTLLAGLGEARVAGGAAVARGALLGRMSERARRLTIELRHNGRPVDVAGMAAQ